MESFTRTFDIPVTATGTIMPIKINEDPSLRTDNLTLITWGTSLILARQLRSITIPPAALITTSPCGPILELGAGTGLVGLAAAAVWKSRVTLTDLAPIIAGLAMNISLNEKLLAEHDGSASHGALDWSEPAAVTLYRTLDGKREEVACTEENKPSVILAADTVYDEQHPDLLSSVISKWLRRDQNSRVIISYPLRCCYLDEIRGVWEKFAEVGLESVEEGQERMKSDDVKFDDEELHEWSVWKWKE